MQGLFANRRTKHAAWFLITAMPLLLAAYMVFQHYRPPLKFGDERTWVDIVIMNSDVALALFFLIVSFVPFFLIFGRKPQARDMVPIAVMAALGVVGRTVFAIVPLPNFKPVSAIVIMTGVVFGPESGFLTGALTGFVSNFIFGQGPWTPWQMFSWGMIGFIAGLLQNAGAFGKIQATGAVRKNVFKAPLWDRIFPEQTKRGDLLAYARSITGRAPLRLCLFGLATGFGYGWFMNLFYLIGYISPINWKTIGAVYLSSFFFDLSHGVCTFLVLWAVGEPWTRKLNRVKVKFGLTGEDRHYTMPPGRQSRRAQECQ